jgi:hypothetical protein
MSLPSSETPEEMYEWLKRVLEHEIRNVPSDAWELINHYRNQARVLRGALEKLTPITEEEIRRQCDDDIHMGLFQLLKEDLEIVNKAKQALAATEKDKWL